MILGGVGLGALVTYLYLNPKVKTTQNLDTETERRNNELRAELIQLTENHASLVAKKEQILESIADIQKQADEASNSLFQKGYELANERMSAAAEKLSAEYEEVRNQMEQEYIEAMACSAASLSKELFSINNEIRQAESQLSDLMSKVTAAIEAAKRQEEMETAQDFYRLNLPEIDIEEITKLRQVTALLRDSEPLNKVIWKVYYEKPYTDLIGRVVGTGVHTGIYKITNLENQKCYVGQAANIADRWKQHIKRGIGAEAPTRNKLYPAMLQHGVENFTFEIVEECSRAMLNEREDYWQDYFGAKEFGYSIK